MFISTGNASPIDLLSRKDQAVSRADAVYHLDRYIRGNAVNYGRCGQVQPYRHPEKAMDSLRNGDAP